MAAAAFEPKEAASPHRTPRALLKSGAVEYGHSICTVKAGEFYSPNRDYPYEGLSAVTRNGCWKFLDSVMFSVRSAEGAPLELNSGIVRLTMDSAVHEYNSKLGRVSASYGVSPSGLSFGLFSPSGCTVGVKLLLDIRFMYDNSPEASQYSVRVAKRFARFSTPENSLRVAFSSPASLVASPDPRQHWAYKLGDGGRSPDGSPAARERVLFSPGLMEFDACKLEMTFFLPCPQAKPPKMDFSSLVRSSRAKKTFGEKQAAALGWRAQGLARFLQSPLPLPTAGAYWFNNAWLPDAFFCLARNPLFCSRFLPVHARRFLEYGATLAEKGSLLPLKLDERTLVPVGESLASTLYFLEAAGKLRRLAPKQFRAAKSLLESLLAEPAGNMAIRSGLLWAPANYGWTDAVVGGVSTRIPPAWREHAREKFALAEMNALWARLLFDYGRPECFEALSSFFRIFGKPPLAHIAAEFGATDAAASSHALASAVTLAPFLSRQELHAALEASRLLWVKRKEKLFGILTLGSGGTYFSDADYHGSVAWPRETVFLAEALELLGEKRLLGEVLESNLEHQQEEGAVFYNQELFAFGNDGPVGVKNPAQAWSQWVDPYLRFAGVLR